MSAQIKLLKPLVNPYDVDRPINWTEQFSNDNPIELEIGFGLGEVLLQSAKDNPDRNFIGIEQNWERLYKTLKTRHQQKELSLNEGVLDNIKILRIDVRIALERLFKEKTLSQVTMLFPCPWPKKGHVKHRLFSNSFLKLLNNRMKENGTAQLVTDDKKFFDWVLEEAVGTGFSWSTEKISPQFNTKFERKWREEGQEIFYQAIFTKQKHYDIVEKEDVELKAYRIKNFDPENLELKDEKGEVCVIFKDKLYDPKQQMMMVNVLVSEGHLFQHLRVVILKQKDSWHIGRAEGQVVFPTPGISQAIKRVYECAKAI